MSLPRNLFVIVVVVYHYLPPFFSPAKHALTKIAKGIIKVCKEDVSHHFLMSVSTSTHSVCLLFMHLFMKHNHMSVLV